MLNPHVWKSNQPKYIIIFGSDKQEGKRHVGKCQTSRMTGNRRGLPTMAFCSLLNWNKLASSFGFQLDSQLLLSFFPEKMGTDITGLLSALERSVFWEWFSSSLPNWFTDKFPKNICWFYFLITTYLVSRNQRYFLLYVTWPPLFGK